MRQKDPYTMLFALFATLFAIIVLFMEAALLKLPAPWLWRMLL